MKKWNDTQSHAYQMQKLRKELNQIANIERFIFLSTLFGVYIEEGKKRIEDYKNMTMFDVTNELALRTQMLKAQNAARVRHHFEEADKQSRKLLEELKRSMQ